MLLYRLVMRGSLGWFIAAVFGATIVFLLYRQKIRSKQISERFSELERLSSELIKANKGKSEFLANVSHEVRTPLNSIIGFTELLQDGLYGDLSPRQLQVLNRVEASSGHLRRLVDQLLDLAKINAGKMDVKFEPLDLGPFLINIATEVESLVLEKGLHMSLSVSSPHHNIFTDSEHLRDIIVNLIGNSVKYTKSGTISIKTKLIASGEADVPVRLRFDYDGTLIVNGPAAWVSISVIDTGIGISANDIDELFTEFFRIRTESPGAESFTQGTGLGLPISRRLARLLNGDITVESELGKGSTFTVWLPDHDVVAV